MASPNECVNVDSDTSDDDSQGDDIASILKSVFDPKNFPFKGYYFYSSPQHSAPNPCMNIRDIGTIGLPLNAREVSAIISSPLTLPPDDKKMVKKCKMQSIWSIEACKIEFRNPHWNTWIENICRETCLKLGVLHQPAKEDGHVDDDSNDGDFDSNEKDEPEKCAARKTPRKGLPQMVLRELRLCGPGASSSFSDTEPLLLDAIGTIVIVLPSAYSGGEVQFSYSSTTRTIDLSPQSSFGTFLLSYYKAVKCQSKPITSGYQLALVYDLRAGSTDIKPPSLPDHAAALHHLESTFAKLNQTLSGAVSWSPIFYVLQRDYGKDALCEGEMCLDGMDRQRVAIIRDAAERHNFLVLLATVEKYTYGYAQHSDEEFGCDWEEWEEGDHSIPRMSERHYISFPEELNHTSISGVVDMEGRALTDLKEIKVSEDEDLLMHKPFFYNMKPTKYVLERHSDECKSLEYLHRRTVVTLVPEDELDELYWSAGKLDYAMKQLNSPVVPPSPRERAWVVRILDHIKHDHTKRRLNSEHALQLMRLSMVWSDLDMWNELMKHGIYDLDLLGVDDVVMAFRTFGFEETQKSVKNISRRSTKKKVLELIYGLPGQATPEGLIDLTWCQTMSDEVLPTLTQSCQDIMLAILTAGVDEFKRLVWSKIVKQSFNFEFWFTLARELRRNCQRILERQAGLLANPPFQTSSLQMTDDYAKEDTFIPAAIAGYKVDISDMVNYCLEMSASRCFASDEEQNARQQSYTAKRKGPTLPIPVEAMPRKCGLTVDRVITFLTEAVAAGYPNVCEKLYTDILLSPGSSGTKYSTLYKPLFPRLLELYRTAGQEICLSPFYGFLEAIIATYLRDILGEKSRLQNYRLRKIGCGCQECGPLSNFMLDHSRHEHTFRLPGRSRDHLEKLLIQAQDLCTYQTIRVGTPHGLRVTKLPGVIHSCTWEGRVDEAKAFLALIGPDDLIAKIMGSRYKDVQDALAGTRPFGSSSLPSDAASGAESSSVAGRKRKLAEIEVIELE